MGKTKKLVGDKLGDWLDDTEMVGDVDLLLEAVGETLWLPDDVPVGVGGGVIVLVTDGLSEAEVVIDVDALLDGDSEVVLEEEGFDAVKEPLCDVDCLDEAVFVKEVLFVACDIVCVADVVVVFDGDT